MFFPYVEAAWFYQSFASAGRWDIQCERDGGNGYDEPLPGRYPRRRDWPDGNPRRCVGDGAMRV